MSDVDLSRTLRDAPTPASGTLERWRWLAQVGSRDLALAKLVEPHLDAAAILADLGAPPPGADDAWAVWAAEPPGLQLVAGPTHDGWVLNGRKAFCSGWDQVTHALVTATYQGDSRLLAVDVSAARAAGTVRPTGPGWAGPGMQRAGTATLQVDGVPARAVGEPGDYTGRTRFWDGAIGVAAVWWGGARAVADTLVAASRRRDVGEHALAHLGAVTSLLDRTWAHLELAARVVDAGGDDGAARRVLAESVRAGVADAATEVVERVGRALGPGPLALDADHAGRVADLLVFVRQHHAERDLAALGRLVADGHGSRP
ncbi:acyl-CoA dehydrogenase family protein [Angustibacter speluncae]